MSSVPDIEAVLVPVQIEAFVLNPAVCGNGDIDDNSARIAPITQPNYTFLRLDNFLIQNDVLNHVDVHNTAPSSINSRMMDLGAQPPRALRHRHGVYVHWVLPRFYRSGVSAADSVPASRQHQERLKKGFQASTRTGAGDDPVSNTPEFVEPPTRWLVIRKIDLDSIRPESAGPEFSTKQYQAWVIESDHLWSLDEIPLDLDLQTDMAPFVVGQPGPDVNIQQQAEVFIGRKTPLEDWSGVENPASDPPNISLLRSSNQLFADFQMHNSNVFSMVDNFQYGSKDAPRYLTHASASYYVLGWHWKEAVDPLWNSGGNSPHGTSLDAFFMDMLGVDTSDPWLAEISQLRIMCHGALYDVNWDYENKPKDVPADSFAARLRDQNVPAISVGTTPMDAIMNYCSARVDGGGDPDSIARLEEDLLALESLLHSRDDGVEGQREAKDTMYNWFFSRSSGGTRYHYSFDGHDGQDGKPLQPDAAAIEALRALNQTVGLLDACDRTMQQYRWDMFSLWWKYVSDVSNKGDQRVNDEFKRKARDISDKVAPLQGRLDDLAEEIKHMLSPDKGDGPANLLANAKPGTEPFFYRANDPTLLVGGVDSGWPVDYLGKLSVRYPEETVTPESLSDLPVALQNMLKSLTSKLPAVFSDACLALVSEFYMLRPGGGQVGPPPADKFYPQFHDNLADGRWRDQWGDRQPWFPLFIEWEAEYTHVPFDFWKLDEHTARLSANKLTRYGISVPSGRPLWEEMPTEVKKQDKRVLSGRVLILPQPSFSLQAKITQLFLNTPPAILDQVMSEKERENLLRNINKLSFLSSPLVGFTDGLLTLSQGSHIKPENKTDSADGEHVSAIGAAIFNDAGLTKSNIELIQGNSAVTPYAAMARFTADVCPFKPVTHGQFRFLKFNVIDKFGQALVAIDQQPRVNGPPPIYPCISDFYEPQTVTIDGQLYANTVIQDNIEQCEFIQLPPQINQIARLNAYFVVPIQDESATARLRQRLHGGQRLANRSIQERRPGGEHGHSHGHARQHSKPYVKESDLTAAAVEEPQWRPAAEWENPVWGWLVVNYADYGLQLFLPDGTFYREVRIGGSLGALPTPKWVPFAPNSADTPPAAAQLDALAEKLSDPTYLLGFWRMVTTAQENLPASPSSYAQVLNSVVGRPLALVNMGWSLELAGPPLEIQSTNASRTVPPRILTDYVFQVRLGDADAQYDGLVGYFNTAPPSPGSDDLLDLNYVNTFFVPSSGTDLPPLRRLDTDTYPRFSPFWELPFPAEMPFKPILPASFDARRNARLQVYGAVLDPFTPVHGYSSFLPPVALQLPPWTWQGALEAMTAFFHAGPVTLGAGQTVPAYDPSARLTGKNVRDTPIRNVALPSMAAGQWSWLQPYVDPLTGSLGRQRGEGRDERAPVFNAFGIEGRGDLNTPGFQDGPYTVVEGFLQLRSPVAEPKAGG